MEAYRANEHNRMPIMGGGAMQESREHRKRGRFVDFVHSNYRSRESIQEGDRFYSPNKTHFVWIVDRIFTPVGLQLPHVMLTRDGERLDRRILAETQLWDRSRFIRDRRHEGSENSLGKRRRMGDKPRGDVRSTI